MYLSPFIIHACAIYCTLVAELHISICLHPTHEDCRNTWVLDPYDRVQEFAHAISLSTIIILVTNTYKMELSPTLRSHKKPDRFILLF